MAADAPTPVEQAQSITDEFYAKHEKILGALNELTQDDGDRIFSPRQDCPGMDQPLSAEEKNVVVTFIEMMGDGTDPAPFVKDLDRLRVDIVATGACKGLT